MGSRFVAHCSPTSMPVNFAPREGCALRHRGVAQSGSAPALGAGCRGFESLHPDQLLSVVPQRRELTFGSVRQTLCLRFLMVAVAHQVEHRIVAPEVAGSRPVSHPTHVMLVDATLPGDTLIKRLRPDVSRRCNEEAEASVKCCDLLANSSPGWASPMPASSSKLARAASE